MTRPSRKKEAGVAGKQEASFESGVGHFFVHIFFLNKVFRYI